MNNNKTTTDNEDFYFINFVKNVIEYISLYKLRILILFLTNFVLFFSILYFFTFSKSHNVFSRIYIPDNSYWEVLFTPKYSFYFIKKNPYDVTINYVKKNFLNILNEYNEKNNLDLKVESLFSHNNGNIYIDLTFKSDEKNELKDFFNYFIKTINTKFKDKTITKLTSYIQNEIDITSQTSEKMEEVISEYGLRDDKDFISQFYAFNLYAPSLVELRLKQLSTQVETHKNLLNNFDLLSPISISFSSTSISNYISFLLILSIFASIFELVILRFLLLIFIK